MVREELYFFTREDAREVSTKGQHASSHFPRNSTREHVRLVEQQMI